MRSFEIHQHGTQVAIFQSEGSHSGLTDALVMSCEDALNLASEIIATVEKAQIDEYKVRFGLTKVSTYVQD